MITWSVDTTTRSVTCRRPHGRCSRDSSASTTSSSKLRVTLRLLQLDHNVDVFAAIPSGLTHTPPGERLALITQRVIIGDVLRSLRDKGTAGVWAWQRSRRLGKEAQRAALRKLVILDAADSLEDLRVPPGNRLEKLKDNRAGQHSIRINSQWRICFRWTDAGPEDVEITDYH